MIQMYDHRAASVIVDESNWMRQGQTDATSLVQHQNPEFFVEPRWWIDESEVQRVLGGRDTTRLIAFKNVTSPTNERTVIASFIPYCGVVHSAPVILTGNGITPQQTTCLLGNLDSLAYDFVCRQKIGGINLSYFIIEQNPTFGPAFYARPCPWEAKRTLEKWISERVLKLTCVSNEMKPLAEAARFKPLVYPWDPGERIELQAELDAAFFLLYGIERNDVEYILSTFSGIEKESEGLLSGGTTAERILMTYDRFREIA